MENRELERHFRDDEILNKISKMFISLQQEKIRTINEILYPVIETLIERMKEKDLLFEKMYKKIIFCGSFYKNTKIEEPNEFDLNIILEMPINNSSINFYPILPAYVKLSIDTDRIRAYNTAKVHHLTNSERRTLEQELISNDILNPNNFRRWIRRIVDQVINNLPGSGNRRELLVNNSKIEIRKSESGPAITLIIDISQIGCISVDLVPALSFDIKVTERLTSKFDKLQQCQNKEWFAIPIPEKDVEMFVESHRWRLSFCHQENEMLKKYGPVKPIIRLMKKLRDTQNWKNIASYYIETVCLNKLSKSDMDINRTTKTLLFFTMLKELHHAFNQHKIEYFWNEKHNLLSNIHDIQMLNIANHLRRIINDIEKNAQNNFILAKYILKSDELSLLKKEINKSPVSEKTEVTNDAERTNYKCVIL